MPERLRMSKISSTFAVEFFVETHTFLESKSFLLCKLIEINICINSFMHAGIR